MAFAIIPDYIVDCFSEALGAVVADVSVRAKDAVADDVVLLDALVHVHAKSPEHDGYQSGGRRS